MIARYCTIAMALLAATVSANPFAAKQSPANDVEVAHRARLMRNAIPTKNSQLGRKLDGEADEVEVDISGYSLRFEKCQFVLAYDDELAEEDGDSILSTQRFVIFRLCPSGSCKSCNSGYGEYMVDMQDYLDYTVAYRDEEQEEMCDTCQEQCYYAQDGDDANADGDNADGGDERRLSYSVDCDTCLTDCEKIANMEDNKYIDATKFIDCVQIQDGNDDGTSALYGGPICASQGSKIKIGVFTDDACKILDNTLDVEDYITNGDGEAMKLSHALLKTTYDVSDCIDCLAEVEDDDGNNGDDANAQAAETKEVCEELYQTAGKCESTHGFTSGLSSDYGNYAANQVSNEELVCDFISSLKSGTYSQDGEIVIGGSKVYTAGGTSTTGGQKFALTFFIIGTVGLAVYAAMLHSQLTKGGKADLSAQGGAMA
eukprot:CAMPEP_0197232888 /NCGR_PEP_ID=MMETSP1429-20130617/1092_1 /TAXON_ID=49237 /ORGANISM="Chaetoceros  sp., Strain UNC1202" /LENGTH=428 /DNA_ID=CAMNT_0042691029 /DNA_START=26 /DNA_END=1312 /DNA_ORIENTATION=+